MNTNPEQIRSWTRANVESILDLTAKQLDACEKLAELNSAASKEALDKAFAYSNSVCRTAANAQAEALKIAERRVAEWNGNVAALLDMTTKLAWQATTIEDESVGAAAETLKSLPRAKKAA